MEETKLFVCSVVPWLEGCAGSRAVLLSPPFASSFCRHARRRMNHSRDNKSVAPVGWVAGIEWGRHQFVYGRCHLSVRCAIHTTFSCGYALQPISAYCTAHSSFPLQLSSAHTHTHTSAHTHRHSPLSFKCTSGFQQRPSNWPRNPRAADKRNTSDRVTRVPECRLHLVNVRLEGPVHPKLTGHLFTPEHHVAVGPGQIPYYFLKCYWSFKGNIKAI